jgi:rhodanese-related sulfurtransferase
MMMEIKTTTAVALQERMANGEMLFLLDVREPHEFKYAHIAGSVLIPLNQISQRLNELDPEQEIIVICHHGIRSQQAAHYLEQQGFKNIVNLVGGVAAWASECDLSMPRY